MSGPLLTTEREQEVREIARTNRGFINHALVDALAALDAERALTDEWAERSERRIRGGVTDEYLDWLDTLGPRDRLSFTIATSGDLNAALESIARKLAAALEAAIEWVPDRRTTRINAEAALSEFAAAVSSGGGDK